MASRNVLTRPPPSPSISSSRLVSVRLIPAAIEVLATSIARRPLADPSASARSSMMRAARQEATKFRPAAACLAALQTPRQAEAPRQGCARQAHRRDRRSQHPRLPQGRRLIGSASENPCRFAMSATSSAGAYRSCRTRVLNWARAACTEVGIGGGRDDLVQDHRPGELRFGDCQAERCGEQPGRRRSLIRKVDHHRPVVPSPLIGGLDVRTAQWLIATHRLPEFHVAKRRPIGGYGRCHAMATDVFAERDDRLSVSTALLGY
jgi:hypothetical protein